MSAISRVELPSKKMVTFRDGFQVVNQAPYAVSIVFEEAIGRLEINYNGKEKLRHLGAAIRRVVLEHRNGDIDCDYYFGSA
jgi:hypothetical protein